MRDWDIEMLYHFISRPGMYTGESEERGYKGIDNFLMAYELGSKGECNFRNEISNLILRKYNVPMPSNGLIGQLKIAADSRNIDWIDIFKELGEKIIIQHSDKDNEFKYRKILRNKILKLINKQNIEEVLINFYQFERQTKEWKGINLDKDEIKQLELVMSILKSNPVQFGGKISNKASSEIMRLKEIIETKHDR